MEYPEEIYVGLAKPYGRSRRIPDALAERSYRLGYEAGKAEQSDYIQSMSSLESVLTDVEQLEGEDLPFVKRLIERTVRAVRDEKADSLEVYSNLTAALKSGDPIDWEKLDGKKVLCVSPGVGELRGVLARRVMFKPDLPEAWWGKEVTAAYVNALNDGWHGQDGWTLWVEGEIPLRRKTADQLEVGTYFLGEAPGGEPDLVYVGGCSEASKVIYYAPAMLKSDTPAYGWVVIKELGTFQGPESN